MLCRILTGHCLAVQRALRLAGGHLPGEARGLLARAGELGAEAAGLRACARVGAPRVGARARERLLVRLRRAEHPRVQRVEGLAVRGGRDGRLRVLLGPARPRAVGLVGVRVERQTAIPAQ